MSELQLTDAGRVALLQGWLARGAASRIHLLSAGSAVLAVLVLSSPCGEIVDGQLVLAQEDPEGDLIAMSGAPVLGAWYSHDNVLLATGTVSDEAGAGPFKLKGTAGAYLYAGGRAELGATALS